MHRRFTSDPTSTSNAIDPATSESAVPAAEASAAASIPAVSLVRCPSIAGRVLHHLACDGTVQRGSIHDKLCSSEWRRHLSVRPAAPSIIQRHFVDTEVHSRLPGHTSSLPGSQGRPRPPSLSGRGSLPGRAPRHRLNSLAEMKAARLGERLGLGLGTGLGEGWAGEGKGWKGSTARDLSSPGEGRPS